MPKQATVRQRKPCVTDGCSNVGVRAGGLCLRCWKIACGLPVSPARPGVHVPRVRTDGYVEIGDNNFVHRMVMEVVIGRPLRYDDEVKETVHHKNGIKTDNTPDNLELRVSGLHPGRALRTCLPSRTRFWIAMATLKNASSYSLEAAKSVAASAQYEAHTHDHLCVDTTPRSARYNEGTVLNRSRHGGWCPPKTSPLIEVVPFWPSASPAQVVSSLWV